MKLTRIPSPVYRVRLNGIQVPYTIRRSHRAKHLRITISAHDGVVLTYPTRLRRYINPDEFIREKQEWVLKHLERIGHDGTSEQLTDGTMLAWRGAQYELRIRYGERDEPEVRVGNGTITLALPEGFDGSLRTTLRSWYRTQAAAAIEREARLQSERIGVRYNRITVRDQKTKWGSCSRKGNLSFNWRLVLFPPHVLRYIVIHELCHLRHFDHSPAFWNLVARHVPDYERSVTWLRDHGARMEGPLRQR